MTNQRLKGIIVGQRDKIKELEVQLAYANNSVDWHEKREWEIGEHAGDLEHKIAEANKILNDFTVLTFADSFRADGIKWLDRLRKCLANERKPKP